MEVSDLPIEILQSYLISIVHVVSGTQHLRRYFGKISSGHLMSPSRPRRQHTQSLLPARSADRSMTKSGPPLLIHMGDLCEELGQKPSG